MHLGWYAECYVLDQAVQNAAPPFADCHAVDRTSQEALIITEKGSKRKGDQSSQITLEI